MGIVPVTIYSEADRTSLHVLLSDEAHLIGPPPPEKSYLDMEKIVWLMKKYNIEAVHPGYGFLAENPDFAQLIRREGLVFIGPGEESLSLAGDKIMARRLAERQGIPVIPGSKEGVNTLEDALRIAEKIGYPVLLKAAMGGGGKGMRVVRKREEMPSSFQLAQQETLSAFGDETLYIEKYLENPHHVEIQGIVDGKGNVYILGERECSIQRRHQKILEESPSPTIDDRTRRDMEEAAREILKSSKYLNAGTIEFLVDGDRFYFLEVNARLQVEHPVTELRYNVDLVKAQILVASGEVPFPDGLNEPAGHSIEVRVYAEDPENDFYPSPGQILFLIEPGGPHIRVDSGIYPGFEVPLYYDPLLSKIISWGKSREEAIRRLKIALNETIISGIKTNIPFHRALLENEDFIRGEYDTNFLKRFSYRKKDVPEEAVVAVGVYAFMKKKIFKERGIERESEWKLSGRPKPPPIPWEVI
jgi:acetyl-CoA carboxylase biotin carboxylase subunit